MKYTIILDEVEIKKAIDVSLADRYIVKEVTLGKSVDDEPIAHVVVEEKE